MMTASSTRRRPAWDMSEGSMLALGSLPLRAVDLTEGAAIRFWQAQAQPASIASPREGATRRWRAALGIARRCISALILRPWIWALYGRVAFLRSKGRN